LSSNVNECKPLIHGGAMIGSKGLDDGVDHDISRDMAGAHT